MTQDEALTILKTGANVFLTGEPGSGKTHTVNAYVSYLNSCGIEPAVTASTGIAATHIGGMTIHSWCGIGIRRKLTPYDLDTISGNRKIMERVGNATVLIIDEVSMLSANTLAMTDSVCREVRRRDEPFGGLQVVLVGDFFQLPPVVSSADRYSTSTRRSREDDLPSLEFNSGNRTVRSASNPAPWERSEASGFAFTSSSWNKATPLICYLSEQHRQEDPAFLEFLGAVRRGEVAERHKALLRTRYAKSAGEDTTQLYSHNANVDHINTAELSKLSGQPKVFVMTGTGPDALVVALKRGCLSPEVLSLKIGARVMFTKNDMGGRFVNGTTGVIEEFTKEAGIPVVKTDAGKLILADSVEWNIQDGGRILARISQIPLRLAWAITVHKSQGMSLDNAHMDLSGAFEYGQGYVAISRVRKLSGLSLSGLNARALEVHPEIKKKDIAFRKESDAARNKFRQFERHDLSRMHGDFIHAIGGKIGAGRTIKKKKVKVDTLSLTKELVLSGMSIEEAAEERGMTTGTILNHLEKLKEKKSVVPVRDLVHISPDPDRLAEITKAFKKVFAKTKEMKLSPTRSLLDDSFSFEELRLARLFITL